MAAAQQPDADEVWAIGQRHEQVADYERAAAAYEDFASTYAKHPRAGEALHNAYLFRVGLGDDEAAKADLTAYEALYRNPDPERSAALFWTHVDEIERDRERRRQAQRYLDDYGDEAGLDQRIVATAVIAQADWRRSCREPLLLDTCISVERERVHPSQRILDAVLARPSVSKPARYRRPAHCASSKGPTLTVHRRRRELAEQAQAGFALVIKLTSKGNPVDIPETDLRRQERYRDAWAMAMVYRADRALEDYLRVRPPTTIAAFDEVSSLLPTYLETKYSLAAELTEDYYEVQMTGSPYWNLAAASRVGIAYESFMTDLQRFPIPRDLSTKAEVESFCGNIDHYLQHLPSLVHGAYGYCVERSTEYQYFNGFSRECEARLFEHMPLEYPQGRELFGQPGLTGSGIDRVGLLDDEQRRALLK